MNWLRSYRFERKNRHAHLSIGLVFVSLCTSNFKMNVLGKKAFHILLCFAVAAIFYTSCANVGMPKGGKKDVAPPTVLKSLPADGQLNFSDTKIRIYFDEFVQNEGLSEKFVISPPIAKRPLFRTKGKSLVVELNDKLQPDKTYSLDFKDGIVDYNERNPLKNYRLAFSTGNVFDSLRIVGFVKNAFNLEPIAGSYIALYSADADSMVYTTKPEYIAKTDSKGFFAVTNIPPAKYRVYALGDVDNNLKYTAGVDSIAFLDTLVVPSATYSALQDTAVTGSDTLVVFGKTRFYPDPIHLLRFSEDYFNLMLDKYERLQRHFVDLYFTQSVADTFDIALVNAKPEGKWNLIEQSPKKDTLKVWLTDSTVYKKDTLIFKLSYQQQDSLGNFYVKNDTIKLYFTDRKNEKVKRGERRKTEAVIETVNLMSNATANFDIYRKLMIQSPEPVASFDTTMIRLTELQDTVYVPVPFTMQADSASRLKYWVSHPWKFGGSYKLSVDSAALYTIYNLPNKKVDIDIKIKEEEQYGKLIYKIGHVEGPTVIQLLSADVKETVIRSIRIDKDEEITIQYLEPQKYLLKAIIDRNNNGVWDTGDLKAKRQPEEVFYYQSVIKIRPNWDNKDQWSLPPLQFDKKIVDKEAEEEKLKNEKKNQGKRAPQNNR